MKVSRELAIQILEYCYKHKRFQFPFLVMCKEYFPRGNAMVNIDPVDWKNIVEDDRYQTFELREYSQNLNIATVKLMAKGFIEKITDKSLDSHIKQLSINYKEEFKEELSENAKI
ncbi:MAG: hypothetical protein AAB966_00510 [Patescibacteria group bacterium]